MKHYKKLFRFCCFACCGIMLIACESMNWKQGMSGLAKVGLVAAVAGGKVKMDDALVVTEGTAVLRRPGGVQNKVLDLAEMGLEEAVRREELNPGDGIVLRQVLRGLQTEATGDGASK